MESIRWARRSRLSRARPRPAGGVPRPFLRIRAADLGVNFRSVAQVLRALGMLDFPGGAFLGTPSRVPRIVSLPQLLRASDELTSDVDPSRAVKQLLDTRTSGLGGARPKASVLLEDGSLVIAKIPHGSDQWDVMAWEFTALDLMGAAGIRVPARRLTRVGGRHVLILRRFDRTGSGADAAGSRGHRAVARYRTAQRRPGAGDHADGGLDRASHGGGAGCRRCTSP